MQYKIHEANIDRLRSKMRRIQAKCARYGSDFSYNELSETFEKVFDNYGNAHVVKYIIVDAHGTTVINNWKFVGAIEHTANGNIIKNISGVDVPRRFYTAPPICEHCKSERHRKMTYLIQSITTGEYRQVGKSCLCDYTHGMNAETVAEYISAYNTLIQGEKIDIFKLRDYISLKEYMEYVAETVRCFGYVKTNSDDRPTANRALDYYRHGDNPRYRAEMVNAGFAVSKSTKTASDALHWIEKQTANNEYMQNLITVCKSIYIDTKHTGIAASLIPTYLKHLDREQRHKDGLKSVFVGNVKDRITVDVVDFRCVTCYNSVYGIVYIYQFTDGSGNIFTWKTSKQIDGGTINGGTIKGIVKEHTEYNGVKQTALMRCTVN